MPPSGASDRPRSAAVPGATGSSRDPTGARLELVVLEDAPEASRSFTDLLGPRHQNGATPTFLVETCADVGAAMERLATRPPHLVLLDLDGRSVGPLGLDRLIEACETEAVPLVVAARRDDIAAARAAVDLGAEGFLVKEECDGALCRETVVEAVDRHRITSTLRQRTDEVQTFTYGITHDLRGPLATMDFIIDEVIERALAGPSEDEGPSTVGRDRAAPRASIEAEELVPLMRRLRDNVRVMETSIDSILAFAHADLPMIADDPVDLQEVVREAVQMLPPAPGYEASVVVSAEGESAVRADRHLMARLMWALLENAVVHGRLRDRPCHVEVRVRGPLYDANSADPGSPQERRTAGHVRVEVEDAGPGVATEDRPRIFRPFQRAAPAERQTANPSTGLGLATAKRIVRRHGGRIGVEDGHSLGGACFWLELPLAEPRDPTVREEVAEVLDRGLVRRRQSLGKA